MRNHWGVIDRGMVDWGVGYSQGCVVDGSVSDGELWHVVSDGDARVGGGSGCVSDQRSMVDWSVCYS